MVFVTIGTQKQQFKRIFHLIENSRLLKDKQIIAQIGNTNYENSNMKVVKFLDQELLEKYINESEFVITHGGVGTIFTALKMNKKVLVVPRLKRYKEHKNDHQLEICKELQEEGLLVYLKENDNIDEKINELLNKNLKKYNVDYNFINTLRDNI